MNKLIATLGISVMVAKYALVVIVAGLTFAMGANAADASLVMLLDND